VTIPTQHEIPRTPGEIGVPNTLFDLITIYDDEESSEVSLITLVPITEEKEPGGTSAPTLDASIPNPLQGDHEVESTLDTEFLDLSGTLKDNSRDELGSGEQEEELQQLEIDTSTVDHQVSVEPVTVSPIKVDTPPADEHQMKVEPLEHTKVSPVKEVQESVLEKIYMAGSLGNTLTWGDQQILEPMDEVVDIQVISYDRKRKSIMRRTTKKRRLTLDSVILITIEESCSTQKMRRHLS
jgi:hypothetical protein